jgi:hypothetical protein
MDSGKAKAPLYRVQPVADARGGDSDWMIGALWGFVLLITSAICVYAVLPISSFESSVWLDFHTVWRITPVRIVITLLMYALAGAIQRWTLRNWLPLSRWWIASVVGGHGVAQAAEYLIDRARHDLGAEVIAQGNLPAELGWVLAAALQALLLRRFSRLNWAWLVPPLAAMGLIWLGGRLHSFEIGIAGWAAYLLLGAVALVRVLRAAPYPDGPA